MSKVNDVLQFLSSDDKVIISDMVARAGANGEITVNQLLALYPHTDPNRSKEETKAMFAIAFVKSDRFSAKLDFQRRCEVLALCRWGLSNEIIAKMYGIDRRTVSHVKNPHSIHYKKVREEEIALGRDRFLAKYVTQDIMNKALAFKKESEPTGANNKHANSKQGVHTVQNDMCDFPHRVIIQWREDVGVPGWYYCDLDSDMPDRWFQTGDDSLKTSQACYNGMMKDIADPIK